MVKTRSQTRSQAAEPRSLALCVAAPRAEKKKRSKIQGDAMNEMVSKMSKIVDDKISEMKKELYEKISRIVDEKVSGMPPVPNIDPEFQAGGGFITENELVHKAVTQATDNSRMVVNNAVNAIRFEMMKNQREMTCLRAELRRERAHSTQIS
jgi:hypothetical protein